MPKKRIKDAVEILRAEIRGDGELEEMLSLARINAEVAQLIYDARREANLTQQELADLVGTTQPVISRLEDSDYDGHSLSMLARIASALHKKLNIRLIDTYDEEKQAA